MRFTTIANLDKSSVTVMVKMIRNEPNDKEQRKSTYVSPGTAISLADALANSRR